MPPLTVQQAFELALQHHNAGRLAEAEALYRQILAVEPRHADSLHLLGLIGNQVGRNDIAVDLIRQAIAIAPEQPTFHSTLGNALGASGRLDEAIAAYRRAAQLKPDYADAHYNLGIVLGAQGRLDEAVAAYGQALRFRPDYAEAHSNLGIVLAMQRRLDEAVASYQRALQIRPGYAEARNNLGVALAAQRRLDEAITEYRRALQLRPNYSEAQNNLAIVLKDTGRLDEAIACYQRAMIAEPANSSAHSNLIYTLHFHPAPGALSIAEEHRRWEQKYAEPLRKFHRPHANDRDPERRLRIGFVSPDFWHHVICHFLAPLLEAHDHAGFEIFCYASVKMPDAVTERLKKTADVWRDVLGMSDDALAERIREDRIDLLVDLTQHMADNRLAVFARKPAPVQVGWLGYPGSTGLSAMDWRITDAWMEPEGAAWSESVEKVVRLPDSWFCFAPVDEYPEPGALPALRAGHVTFGCLNNLCKMNGAVVELWATVMRAVENSRLLLQCPAGETQARVRQWFEARGIAAERLELVERTATRGEFLRLFDRMDMALDPFPYNGGTTTCEALWMGVPVLTLPGSVTVSRIGLSILMACGMPEFIAHNEEEYVRLAATLAADLPRLAQLRATLRGRMKVSAFMDGPRFARSFEHACREMWRAWCARQCSPPAS